MTCENCNYLFDPKQHGIDLRGHFILNRPMGIPNGWSVAVTCPRCLCYQVVKREYGVVAVAKVESDG